MGVGASSASRPASSKNRSQVSVKHPVVSKELLHKKEVKPQHSQSSKDLMISYSHADKEVMARIKNALEESGITVWVDVIGLDAGVDFLSKIGQAIIEAKLFVSLLSKTSVKSKFCQDELALAYVSDTAIFPVTLVKPKELYPLMDTGMKLQLARYQWLSLCDMDQFDAEMAKLIKMLKDFLANDSKDNEVAKKPNGDKPKMVRQKSRMNLNRRKGNNLREYKDEIIDVMPDDFWGKFYTGDRVEWNKFVDNFQFLYKAQLQETFMADDQTWLVSILHREMEVLEDGMLEKSALIAFCTLEGEVFPLWKRVQDQAIESYAM